MKRQHTTGNAMKRSAVALLTFRPDVRQVAFYEGLVDLGYDVHVVVDDNSFVPPVSSRADFVQLDERICIAAGYHALNHVITSRKPLPVSAWEKALFYFNRIDSSHDHVWFMEDDVFLPSHELLAQVDARHSAADLLCKKNRLNMSGELRSWPWWQIVPQQVLPLPWASSMVCAARLSRALLAEVDQTLASCGKRMHEAILLARLQQRPSPSLFIEFLFNTLALHRQMTIELPDALRTIGWRRVWSREEIIATHIYHPVKNQALQEEWRSSLAHADTGSAL